MLELVDVHTYYGDSYILQGISLRVEDRSAVTLLGRNGMGKTTTLRTIIGFTPPQRGTIRFKDKTIIGLKPFRIAQMGIGLVPQGRQIFPSLSVYENLVMAARGGVSPPLLKIPSRTLRLDAGLVIFLFAARIAFFLRALKMDSLLPYAMSIRPG